MEHFLATWGYLALFVIVFLSSMGIPVGSEVATAYAGVLASGQVTSAHDHLALAAVIVVGTLGELAGSSAGYLIGRFGGRPLVDRVGKYVLLAHRDLDRAEAWFARRGEPFVLFGRFIPLLRSFVSLAAGLGEMSFGKFAAFTVIGCGVWNAGVASLGYSLGASWHHVIKDFSDAGYVLAAAAALAVAIAFAHRVRQLRAERAGVPAGAAAGAGGPPPGATVGDAAVGEPGPERRFVTSSRKVRAGTAERLRDARGRGHRGAGEEGGPRGADEDR